MKKTYLKPATLTVNIVPQQLMTLSKYDTPASKTGKVYERGGRFSDWNEDSYEE